MEITYYVATALLDGTFPTDCLSIVPVAIGPLFLLFFWIRRGWNLI